MKPLIALFALGLGVAAIGVTVEIQANRFAFTSMGEKPAFVAEVSIPVKPVVVPSRVVQLDEVTVEGMLTPRPAARKRATPPRAAPPPEAEPIIHIVPAPCVDGEYRKLEENRGVRLMCPGNS